MVVQLTRGQLSPARSERICLPFPSLRVYVGLESFQWTPDPYRRASISRSCCYFYPPPQATFNVKACGLTFNQQLRSSKPSASPFPSPIPIKLLLWEVVTAKEHWQTLPPTPPDMKGFPLAGEDHQRTVHLSPYCWSLVRAFYLPRTLRCELLRARSAVSVGKAIPTAFSVGWVRGRRPLYEIPQETLLSSPRTRKSRVTLGGWVVFPLKTQFDL